MSVPSENGLEVKLHPFRLLLWNVPFYMAHAAPPGAIEEGGMVAPSNNPSTQSGTATSSTLDGGGSKARSKSLNEITILEHEQFIARNDDDLRYFVGTEQRLGFSASTCSRDDSPYEGDTGYVLGDTGDSSDYFYGVRLSLRGSYPDQQPSTAPQHTSIALHTLFVH